MKDFEKAKVFFNLTNDCFEQNFQKTIVFLLN